MTTLPRLLALLPLVLLPVLQDPAVEQTRAPAAPERTALADEIDALLQDHQDLDQLSGAVLVADGGEVIYRGAFGVADADWGIPNTPDTRFRLASITKQFTAMLTLLLVEDGALELDAPITSYLTDYPAESGDRVTVRQLLNHTSGIPSYTSRPGFFRNEGQRSWGVDEFVATFCSDPLEFEPGERFSYNNSGYFLLGAIAERVTGQTFAEALRERVLEPLGMDDTGVDDPRRIIPGRATGYEDVLGFREVSQYVDMTTPYAAGAMYSTVGDLWTWDQALRARTLLDGELEQAMFTPGLGDYGFGWEIRPERAEDGTELVTDRGPIVSHGGGMPGVRTTIFRMPELGRCIIVLGNTSVTATGAIELGVSRILDDGEPWPATRRGDYAVAAAVIDEGAEAAMELLARLPQVVQDEYIERDVNAIGYRLMQAGAEGEALAVFEFLTVAYAESANTWDSLGEARRAVGDHEGAIESYRKALELDPEYPTALAALELLGALEPAE